LVLLKIESLLVGKNTDLFINQTGGNKRSY
jgi:hypothetical protein